MTFRSLLLLAATAAVIGAQTFDDLSARATAARNANDIPQAVELYRQALQSNANWEEGWWFLGTLLYDADQFAPARDAFQHFVALNAKAAPGWAFLGLCEFETKDYAKALPDIEHSLSLGADKEQQLAPVLLYHEALLLTHDKQFDRALQIYAPLIKGMSARSLNEPMLVSIGLPALRAPLLPQDVPDQDKPLYATVGKAASFTVLGDYARADLAFDDLLQNYPQKPFVHYMHGIYLLARDPDQAFEEFKRELNVAPANSVANAMLAWGLLTRGDSQEALPYAEKSVDSPDNTPFAKYLLGRALVETGALQRGLAYLQESENSDNTNADVHVTLAAAYARLGQPKEARRERDTAMQMESENGPVGHP